MSVELGALARIVGEEHAFSGDDKRAAPYHDIFGFIAGCEGEFHAVARPGDVEQVQAVVRHAVASELSVWSTCNGSGNGARPGGSGPGIVVDLQRLDRVLEVDTRSACALVEPGVSYRQLAARLQGTGLWVDADENPEHSVAGSICTRQTGHTPYGDHLLMQCGMEVVLADGELLRTGMGALPGNDTWQLFKYNFGPYLDGLFTQSDLGLVTKVGLWLMPAPPRYLPFMVTLPDETALGHAAEVLRPLRIANVIPNAVSIRSAELDSAPFTSRAAFTVDGQLALDRLVAGRDCGRWNLYGALYDSEANLAITRDHVFGLLQGIPGARLFSDGERDTDAAWQARRTLMGGGVLDAAPTLGDWGGEAAMWLTLAAPIEDRHVLAMQEIAGRVLGGHGLDRLCEFLVTSRTVLFRVLLPYRRRDGDSVARAVDAARLLLHESGDAGFGVVDESVELRELVAAEVGGGGLDVLVGRVREAVIGTGT